MAIIFKNQRKENYYIKSKLTKTGKTTYFLTKKMDKDCLDFMPAGYEVFEKYDSQMMFIRKAQPKQFSEKELKIIENVLKKNKSIADFKLDSYGDEVKIYVAEENEIGARFGLSGFEMKQLAGLLKNFRELMKIKVEGINEDKSYEVMRFCFRGSIDDWITIGWGSDLKELAQQYLIHLGKESYYDLM